MAVKNFMKHQADINESIPFLLNAVSDNMRLYVNQALKDCGITWKQLFVLMNCELRGGQIRVGDLKGALAIDPGATSRLIQRLEAQNWVKRFVDKKDKRFASIQITAEGQAVMRKASPIREKNLTKLLSVLDESEREKLRSSLKLMLHFLVEH